MRVPRFRLSFVPVVTALAGAAAACEDASGLPPATIANLVDTISLFALDGTPLSAPSGFNIEAAQVLRTDRSARFDFAFNLTPAGDAVLLPTGALDLGRASGILVQSTSFDSVRSAPVDGYTDSLPVVVDSGTVAVVRSRPSACVFGAVVFFYGKVQVLAVDTVARRIDLQVLVDQNCGYRDLEPGIPRR
ncbi:MAG: hypothetical protein ACREMF_04430 [Gemmatimonadales bacterium]